MFIAGQIHSLEKTTDQDDKKLGENLGDNIGLMPTVGNETNYFMQIHFKKNQRTTAF